eukprot:s10614_g1.t1
MMDLLYALPILGVEKCVKDELETTSHPCWVCRWKEHAQKGNVVFGTLVDKESLLGDDGRLVGVLESIREPVNWQCDCSWHVASDYASRFNMNLPCILWEHIWKHLGENTQKLMEDERSIEQAVLAAVAVRDFEENKRKRREELDAAEEEAAKKARRSLEQPSPSGFVLHVAGFLEAPGNGFREADRLRQLETSIAVRFERKGAVARSSWWGGSAGPCRAKQPRGSATLICFSSPDEEIQRVLPQIFIGNHAVFPVKALRKVAADKPATCQLWREKSSWNNASLMRKVVDELQLIMTDFPDRQPCIVMDCATMHIARKHL